MRPTLYGQLCSSCTSDRPKRFNPCRNTTHISETIYLELETFLQRVRILVVIRVWWRMDCVQLHFVWWMVLMLSRSGMTDARTAVEDSRRTNCVASQT